MTVDEFVVEREDNSKRVAAAHEVAVGLFRLLGFVDNSNERTAAMCRTEEVIAYIERLVEKAK